MVKPEEAVGMNDLTPMQRIAVLNAATGCARGVAQSGSSRMQAEIDYRDFRPHIDRINRQRPLSCSPNGVALDI